MSSPTIVYSSLSYSDPSWITSLAASKITGAAALTKTDDTNVTLTLGGTPASALLAAASITVGWTGTLAVSRGGTGASTLAGAGIVTGSGTTGQAAFWSGTNTIAGDNGFWWDNTNKRLGVGTNAPVVTVHISADGVAPAAALVTTNDPLTVTKNGAAQMALVGVGVSAYVGILARGSLGAPTAVASGDNIVELVGQGYDGTNRISMGTILMSVDGAVSTNIVPSRITLNTMNTSGALTEAMRIDSAQRVLIGATSSISGGDPRFVVKGSTIGTGLVVAEFLDAGGVHSIYFRPDTSSVNLISSNYQSGGVYLPLALSGRENVSDFNLLTNGNATFGNSVGIGTPSPGAIVDIQGAGGTKFINLSASSSGTSFIYSTWTNTGGNLRTGVESSTGGSLAIGTLAYASVIGSNNATAFQLIGGGVVGVTIDASQRVGIGTTSPSGLFHVHGTGDVVAFASGGLAVGGTSDPGAGILTVATDIIGAPCSLMFAGNLSIATGGGANGSFIWGNASSTSASNATAIAERAMILSRLYVYLRLGQGANGSFVATLVKNGTATALSVTVPASSAAGAYADTTHTVSVVAGDLLTINLINNDTVVSTSVGSVSLLSVSH